MDELEDIVLSETRQREKNTTWSHFYVKSKTVRFIETENIMVVTRDLGGRNGEMLVKKYKVSVKNNKFWRLNVQQYD